MSLILDALKKSEAERQRGQVPNLLSPSPATTAHYSIQKKSNLLWIILTAVLFLALLFGYLFVKLKDRNDVDAPDTSGPTATVISQPVITSPETATPAAPTATVATPVIPTQAPAQAAAPAPPSSQTLPIQPISPFATQTTSQATNPEVETVEAQSESRVAGMAEMPVDQRQQLPALKLSMHVYSSESGKRFAIIDGQRVNEGSLIGAAVVEEIRQDGVVLSLQGKSYLLPRP